MDCGAVRLHIPEDWIIEPGKGSIRFVHGTPPNDNCRLECSYLKIPPIDWSELPIAELIPVAMHDDPRNLTQQGETVRSNRQDVDLAWATFALTDSIEQRSAFTRVCIARGWGIQSLIKLDFWQEDAARLEPIWQEVIRTVELGKYINDPTTGDLIH